MKSYVVALLVVVGVLGGFYGGYKIGQNNVSASTASSSGQFNRGAPGGAFAGARGVAAVCPSPGAPTPSPGSAALARGTVTDLAAGSFTVTSTVCDVKVTFGSTVQVSKTVTGSTGDLQDNLTVTIVGTRQADGTILARTIQIGGGGLGGFGGGARPSGG